MSSSCSQFRYDNLVEWTFIERGYPRTHVYRSQEELITPGLRSEQLVTELFT